MTLRFLADPADPRTAYRIDPQTLLAVAQDRAGMQACCEALRAESAAAADPQVAAAKASLAGILLVMLDRAEEAKRCCEFALARQAEPSQSRRRVVTEIRLAQASLRLARGDEAVARLSVVADRCREQRELASPLHFALQHLGKAYWELGRTDQARRALLEALALREASGSADLIESTRLALQLLPDEP